MYTIIGGDGNEYGPVSADQVRDWIIERRANHNTKIKRATDDSEGAEWTPLGDLTEFHAALQHTYPPQPASAETPIEESGTDLGWNEEGQIRPLTAYLQSWQLLLRNLPFLLAVSALFWATSTLIQSIPYVGGLVATLISGALAGGMAIVFLSRIRNEPSRLLDLYAGFGLAFFSLLMGSVLTQLITLVGLVFCLLPGIYFAVAFAFTIPLIIDQDLDFWTAMGLSRQSVTRQWFSTFVLLLLAYLPVLLFGTYVHFEVAGMLHEMIPANPESFVEVLNAIQNAQSQLMEDEELNKKIRDLMLRMELLSMANTPLATGAVLYAYESVFNPRHEEPVN